jgi:hypothetical protein
VSGAKSKVRMTDLPRESAGRVKADGTRVYRLGVPQAIWWAWIGLLVLGGIDLLIQGHRGFSVRFALGLLAVTGVAYALALWPRVTADDTGIAVLNPFRRFLIPWDAVRGIFVADSLEVESARTPPKAKKVVYSWAVTAPRRSRARASYRGKQWDRSDPDAIRAGGALGLMFGSRSRGRPTNYDQLPRDAREAVKRTAGEVIARELLRITKEVTGRSLDDLPEEMPGQSPGGVLSTGWSWVPLAAIVLPVAAFIVSMTIR